MHWTSQGTVGANRQNPAERNYAKLGPWHRLYVLDTKHYIKRDSLNRLKVPVEVEWLSYSTSVNMAKSLALCALGGIATLGLCQSLAPANDIVFPSSKTSSNPLVYAGGNTPYFAGE